MPEFSTLAAVDLGLGDFGSGITCAIGVEPEETDSAFRFIMAGGRRLASAERAQAQADRGQPAGDWNG